MIYCIRQPKKEDRVKYHDEFSSPEVKSSGVVEVPVVLHRSDLERT